jgi:hypothetical protein
MQREMVTTRMDGFSSSSCSKDTINQALGRCPTLTYFRMR